MLDKVIHKHLDLMDKIEDEVHEDIEKIISKIDIDAVMEDAQMEMSTIAQEINNILIDKYFDRVISEGIRFSNEVGNSKKIIVQNTKDPNVNEELVGNDKRSS